MVTTVVVAAVLPRLVMGVPAGASLRVMKAVTPRSPPSHGVCSYFDEVS